jgi:hypothetical protein
VATATVADEALPFDVDARESWLGHRRARRRRPVRRAQRTFGGDLDAIGGLPLCGPLASVEVWGETVASLLPEDVAGSGSLRSDFDRAAFVGFAEGAAVNAQATLRSEAWDCGGGVDAARGG